MAYNGWRNYETWNVNLWIGNEESSYRYWQESAREAYQSSEVTPGSLLTKTDAAISVLMHRLSDHFEAEKPEVQSMWADLLNAALSEVDWYEIAVGLLEGIAPEDEWNKVYQAHG